MKQFLMLHFCLIKKNSMSFENLNKNSSRSLWLCLSFFFYLELVSPLEHSLQPNWSEKKKKKFNEEKFFQAPHKWVFSVCFFLQHPSWQIVLFVWNNKWLSFKNVTVSCDMRFDGKSQWTFIFLVLIKSSLEF